MLVFLQQHFQGVAVPRAELLPQGFHPESPGQGSINLWVDWSVSLHKFYMELLLRSGEGTSRC